MDLRIGQVSISCPRLQVPVVSRTDVVQPEVLLLVRRTGDGADFASYSPISTTGNVLIFQFDSLLFNGLYGRYSGTLSFNGDKYASLEFEYTPATAINPALQLSTIGPYHRPREFGNPNWSGTGVAGPGTFIGLKDCPKTYAGAAGKLVRVRASEDGTEFTELAEVVGDLVSSVVAGTGIAVNDTDPANPIVSLTTTPGIVLGVIGGAGIGVDSTNPQEPVVTNAGVLGVVAGTNVTVDNTNPQHPVVSASAGGGAPSGPAGGALTGTYPNPSLSSGTIASFDAAGAAAAVLATSLQKASNLSDLANAGTARANLGLGTAATTAASAYATAAQGALAATAVQSVVAGTNVTVDNTNPLHPIVSATGGGSSTVVPWFNFVTDFGADPTGAADCTTAWNNFIAAAVTAGGGNLLAIGQFKFSGAMQDSSRGNAQILLPSVNYVTAGPISIGIYGPVQPPAIGSVIGSEPGPLTGCTRFVSTIASGTGALLGGWGPSGSTANFTNVHLTMRNIILQTVGNPTISGLDLSHCASIDLDGVMVFTGNLAVGSVTYPTTATSFGIQTPGLNDGANSVLGTVHVMGFYNGYSIGEHAIGVNACAWFCKNAFVYVAVFHASAFLRMMAVHCTNVIVGFSSGTHVTRIMQLDIEHASSGAFVPVDDLLDASNTLYGDLQYRTVLAGTGGVNTFVVSGGANLIYKGTGYPPGYRTTASSTDTAAAIDLNGLIGYSANCTVTIPLQTTLQAKPLDCISFIATGTGTASVTLSPASGVTIITASTLQTRAQNSIVSIVNLSANSWAMMGDMA